MFQWKSLPQSERERYEAMAKKASEEMRVKAEEQERLERLESLKAQQASHAAAAQAAGSSPMRDTQSPMMNRGFQQQPTGQCTVYSYRQILAR